MASNHPIVRQCKYNADTINTFHGQKHTKPLFIEKNKQQITDMTLHHYTEQLHTELQHLMWQKDSYAHRGSETPRTSTKHTPLTKTKPDP